MDTNNNPNQPHTYPAPPIPYPMYQVAVTKPDGSSAATAGMVLGIVAWSIAAISFGILSPISLVLGIIGLPLSLSGGSRLRAAGFSTAKATAGVALNASGLGLAVWLLIAVVFAS